MQSLWQDLRYGARMLMKQPGFTLIAVLTLALGIGANTAIFSVVNAVLLRPLPYQSAEQLMAVYDALPSAGISRAGLSEAEFLRLRSEAKSFAEVAAWAREIVTLHEEGEPEKVSAALASANLFRVLGVASSLGRELNDEEELTGKPKVVMLSHSSWQRRFSGDPKIIGKSLRLDDGSYTIIGVLPATFQAPPELQADTRIEMWFGYGFNPAQPRRGSFGLNVIGRLQTGVTRAQAEAETNAIRSRLTSDHPESYPKDLLSFVLPLHQFIVGDVRPTLLILWGAALVVLLIACANVANLLLVRGDARQKELAVRAALGASRRRIIEQLLAESLLLVMASGGAGLLLARWGLAATLAISPANVPRLAEASLDWQVAGFVLASSLGTALLVGLLPALHTVRHDLHAMLKEGGRAGGGQTSRNRLRHFLIVAETALSCVLLIAASLLLRSFWNLQQVNTGFQPDHLLTMRLTPPAQAYSDNQQVAALYEGLLSRVQSLPGVASAAISDPLPLIGFNRDGVVEIEGRPFDLAQVGLFHTEFRTVAPEYFPTVGMRLLRGRLLSRADQEGALPVVVVNETFARLHWPNEEALGKRFRSLDAPPEKATSQFVTIAGIVADARNRALHELPQPEVFIPLRQHVIAYGKDGLRQSYHLIVRTLDDPLKLVGLVRQEVRNREGDFIITQVKSLEQIMGAAMMQPRFNLILLGSFAVIALLLGAVGLYGVIAYAVAQRTQEIGIRIALGAQASDVVKLIFKYGMWLTLIGLVLGLLGAWALTGLLTGLLFSVTATDPLTYAAVALLLVSVALLACYLPARRATKVDPMIALRAE